jgi:hypothetical protein
MADILTRFSAYFGQRGGDQIPGNTGLGRRIVHLCQEALNEADPVLFDYYDNWQKRGETEGVTSTPVGTAVRLKNSGLWEGAWAVIQLHSDQMQKKEASDGVRRNKGDAICGMAILGQVFQSHSLIRHYAQLSSAGDVYWEHELTDLQHGGLAPTIMEGYESGENHDRWRQSVREKLSAIPNSEPRYLEPFLLMRWFGPAYWDLFLSGSQVVGRRGLPFSDVLLDLIEQPATKQKGKLFEAAVALLFSATPGFEVRSARRSNDEQIDLVVRYERDPLAVLPLLAGPGLIECKSSPDPVSVNELRDFGSKCLFHRVSFGVLVARANITGGSKKLFRDPQFAELVRRRFLIDGLAILVIDISDLRLKSRELRGLQEPLGADHDYLIFGPIDGGTGST